MGIDEGFEVVMVQEKYGVRPTQTAQEDDPSSAQAITRARILIKIDEGWTAPQVATALDVSSSRYAEEGLDEVLRHHNQHCQPAQKGG